MSEIKFVKTYITEYEDEFEALENIEYYSKNINEIYANNETDENGRFEFDVDSELQHAKEELYTAIKAYIDFQDNKNDGNL